MVEISCSISYSLKSLKKPNRWLACLVMLGHTHILVANIDRQVESMMKIIAHSRNTQVLVIAITTWHIDSSRRRRGLPWSWS
jgi:hypothetical protein